MSESENILEFCVNLHKTLTKVIRYSNTPTIRQQNVAEHQYFVALIAIMIGMRAREDGVNIDLEKIALRALVHDLPETVSGDMPRIVKRENPDLAKQIAILEDKVLAKMIEFLPSYMKEAIWYSYVGDNLDCIENKIVKFADIFECGIFSICEGDLGNTNMNEIMHNTIGWLHDYEEIDLMCSLRECLSGERK